MGMEESMTSEGIRVYEELADIEIPKEQEEMMNIICGAWEECQRTDCRECTERANQYMSLMACTSLKYTRWLLENGYKKQSEGEWISLEPEIGLFACSLCDHRILRSKCNYCPNCGAKMKGGAE
jgi:hypothetical protein